MILKYKIHDLKIRRIQLLAPFLCVFALQSLQPAQAETEGGKLHANNKAGAVKRDPFWPVGYEPQTIYQPTESDAPVRKVTPGEIDWEEAMKKVVINGVSSRATDEYIAVINNEVKSVDDQVTIEYDGVKYTWKVESITPPGSVKLRRHVAE